MSELLLRTSTAHDLDAVAALIVRAYRSPESVHGWTDESAFLQGPRTSAAAVRDIAADPDVTFLTAWDGEDLVGCAMLQRRGSTAYFGMFAVEPRRQTSGIGRRVLAAAEEHARAAWGATALTMTVIAQRTELVAWYERRGYRPTGVSEPLTDVGDGVVILSELTLLELAKPL